MEKTLDKAFVLAFTGLKGRVSAGSKRNKLFLR
jgi:hypothetical protein